jgi:hypothetical protein
MAQIKPQVYFSVKQRLVESIKKKTDTPGMDNPVGKIIKQRLRSLKKTQGWLAEEAEVSNTAVSKWIRTGKISRENAIVVAQILEISLDDLVGSSSESTVDGPSMSLVYVDREELRLLTAYREATEMGQALISAAADGAPRKALKQGFPIRNKT